MKNNFPLNLFSLMSRYVLIILAAFANLWIFYKIFTPLTVYPVYWALKLFFPLELVNSELILINNTIEIWLIPACIAGAAYYLLFALNLSLPNVKTVKRIKMILFAFSLLLIVNILRIILMSLLYIQGNPLFDIAHLAFWYGISILFVIFIWFLEVKIFRIKDIPIYSDLRALYLASIKRDSKRNLKSNLKRKLKRKLKSVKGKKRA
ncbi:MAG TPA: pacearchaeosortase [Candidatus Pacearchaeota archaeon]|nr:pacearchaeosortase [Candidatus Pacearchaeota archaeon]